MQSDKWSANCSLVSSLITPYGICRQQAGANLVKKYKAFCCIQPTISIKTLATAVRQTEQINILLNWDPGVDSKKELKDNQCGPQITSMEGECLTLLSLFLKMQTVMACYLFRKLFLANHYVKVNCYNNLPSEVNSLPNSAKFVTSKQIRISKALFWFITYLVPIDDGSQPGSLSIWSSNHLFVTALILDFFRFIPVQIFQKIILSSVNRNMYSETKFLAIVKKKNLFQIYVLWSSRHWIL